jgi:hypothetical protein
VVLALTDQEDDVMSVIASLQIVAIPHVVCVIGHVIVDTLKTETAVSVITTLLIVLLDNMLLGIPVIPVTLFHQTDTIQLLAHVIGHVIVATTSQVIVVSVITIITTSMIVLSENTK